jgi:hypothetical protein
MMVNNEFQLILDEFNRRRLELAENNVSTTAWDDLHTWVIQAILESLRNIRALP